ncbi:MAG TPA: M50 family metallopeptidase [Verrucomicrobiae bacterium]|nr:M50 family metallopeptidase [Verrucomicrobiae bacterium]
MPTRNGSIRLFRLLGITVYLHWSWFIIAAIRYQVHSQWHQYNSPVWYVWEYLALFLFVLMHEFGHQLACRSVGGKTHDIVLWPFGGVAYVTPPQRPAAQLWSIVAGPLVNVVLFPILAALFLFAQSANWAETMPDVFTFITMIWLIDTVLLVFNLLPVYPLDGGQILRSLLWFGLGRERSLMIATVIGFFGIGGLIIFAIFDQSLWLCAICVFVLLNCWNGFQQARAMMKVARSPRRADVACPVCKAAPPRGAFWICGRCRKPFDTFETQGICPHCGTQYAATSCPECGSLRPISEWMAPAIDVPPKL